MCFYLNMFLRKSPFRVKFRSCTRWVLSLYNNQKTKVNITQKSLCNKYHYFLERSSDIHYSIKTYIAWRVQISCTVCINLRNNLQIKHSSKTQVNSSCSECKFSLVNLTRCLLYKQATHIVLYLRFASKYWYPKKKSYRARRFETHST